MKIEIPVELLQPWSTFVMKTQLPPPILEKMIKITDEIVEDQAIKSENIALSDGLIEDQFKIREEKLEGTEIVEFFGAVCKNYIIQAFCQAQPFNKDFYLKEEFMIELTTMWVNSQKDNEYLPIHQHLPHLEHRIFPGHVISAVMYLKIPEYYVPRTLSGGGERLPYIKDGAIIFTNNSSQDQHWADPVLEIVPQVGDFLIFLSSQSHQVYPFRTADGKGERRSVSFNAVFSSKTEHENEQNETKKKYVDGNLR